MEKIKHIVKLYSIPFLVLVLIAGAVYVYFQVSDFVQRTNQSNQETANIVQAINNGQLLQILSNQQQQLLKNAGGK